MKDKKTSALPQSRQEHLAGENLDIAWGENDNERVFEKASQSLSVPHECKGTHCETAFDKL